jgi:hypothetical protein
MGTLQTIVPKETPALSRRLWLRGAKRLGLLAFDADQISERAASVNEVVPAADVECVPTLFGASLYRSGAGISPLTPPKSAKDVVSGARPSHGGVVLPTASYWAFGRQQFDSPDRLQALPQRAKSFKLSLIFTRPILPPSQRTAHGQAFLEFTKWELARLITEAIPKYEVTYLIEASAQNETWEHYDVILRSRKPELVNFLTSATPDEQIALAMDSDAVLTDHHELGAAVWGHGRRSLVLGGGWPPPGVAPSGANVLSEWSLDRGAMERLISPPPKGKPSTPDDLAALQTTVTQELAAGSRWFEA